MAIVYHGYTRNGLFNKTIGKEPVRIVSVFELDDGISLDSLLGESAFSPNQEALSNERLLTPIGFQFSWGENSRRTALARSILRDFLGESTKISENLVRFISREVIANLPEEWYLSEESLTVYLKSYLEVISSGD